MWIIKTLFHSIGWPWLNDLSVAICPLQRLQMNNGNQSKSRWKFVASAKIWHNSICPLSCPAINMACSAILSSPYHAMQLIWLVQLEISFFGNSFPATKENSTNGNELAVSVSHTAFFSLSHFFLLALAHSGLSWHQITVGYCELVLSHSFRYPTMGTEPLNMSWLFFIWMTCLDKGGNDSYSWEQMAPIFMPRSFSSYALQ